MQITATRTVPSQAAGEATQARAAALLAASLGALLLLGVGFLQAETAHDAAHDTRHAIGFPCH